MTKLYLVLHITAFVLCVIEANYLAVIWVFISAIWCGNYFNLENETKDK